MFVQDRSGRVVERASGPWPGGVQERRRVSRAGAGGKVKDGSRCCCVVGW